MWADGSPLGPEPAATASQPPLTLANLGADPADSTRAVAVWLEETEETFVLTAVRPRGARGQDRDTHTVTLPASRAHLHCGDAYLSTEYDAAGEPRRFGVELWLAAEPEGEEYPLRIAGEARPDGEALAVTRDGYRISAVEMSARIAGRTGLAVYLLVCPA